MSTIIEFPASIDNNLILVFLRGIKTIEFVFHQTDNLHHKYFVQTHYADDMVVIGRWIGRKDAIEMTANKRHDNFKREGSKV